jgi:hypothetical protein
MMKCPQVHSDTYVPQPLDIIHYAQNDDPCGAVYLVVGTAGRYPEAVVKVVRLRDTQFTSDEVCYANIGHDSSWHLAKEVPNA